MNFDHRVPDAGPDLLAHSVAKDGMAAVDPLTMLEAHTQFYRQLTAHGLQQLEASGRRRREPPPGDDRRA